MAVKMEKAINNMCYILLAVMLAVSLISFSPEEDSSPHFSVRSEDQAILSEWAIPAKHVTEAVLTITGPSAEYKRNIKPKGRYLFKNGRHGEEYSFELSYLHNGNKVTQEFKRFFWDFKKLPNLMTLFINTEDGQDPTYEEAPKPEGVLGRTIINNDYKKAIMNNSTAVKIRIRGNTSGLQEKKPYKLLFNKKIDLLGLGEEYADTEWYLIAQNHLKTYFGLQLSKAAGMEWEPRMRFVNLMLNGDWKGLYILCESIKRHPKRLALKKKGFIIESDAYFWNLNGIFFRSKLLHKNVAFTFKYPKITSKFDPKVLVIQKQIKILEDFIKRKSDKIYEFIDVDTFCIWLAAHELMGSKDGAGTNKYFYKYNMNKKNKLKMGPLWDFDSIFGMKDNEHSRFYFATLTYFPFLLRNKTFKKAYKQKYFEIAPSIEPIMRSALEKLKDIPGLEESQKLDAKIWNNDTPLDSAIEELLKHLHERIKYLNEENAKL